MKKYFSVLVLSFFPILIINLIWSFTTLIILASNGIQYVLQERNFIESIESSEYLKWILLVDVLWVIMFIFYLFSRREYRTEAEKHFLQYNPIENLNICVVIPAYNEELSIRQVVTDYFNQKFVKHVIVIDNHSGDRTVELAKQSGAKVITKNENKGYGHSIVMGLKEALNTDANVILLTEADGTFNAYDLNKMLQYIDHCDVVSGSRQVQILTEKGNLRQGMIHIWGNYFLSKLIQLKYLNLTHLGIINLNDISCMLRLFRRESIEKIHNELNYPGTDIPVGGNAFPTFLAMKCLEKDFRIVEVPVTYKKRAGKSRIGSDKKLENLKMGFLLFWIILNY